MWIGNVRSLSFKDQLKATAAVGSRRNQHDAARRRSKQGKGISPRDMRTMAADAGVSLPILDPMASWAPHWRSGISDPGWMEFLGYAADDFFRIAEELEVSTMTVIGTLQPGLASVPEIAESFESLADRAASHGLRCVLEFIPMWGIRDLGMAWQILQIADRPNTAMAFDFWHYIRGGRDDSLLRSIPGARSPMFRSPMPKRRYPLDARWMMIVCFIVCRPGGEACRSRQCWTFFAKSARSREWVRRSSRRNSTRCRLK